MTMGTRMATRGGERRGAAEQAGDAARGDLGRDQAEGEEAADDEPGHRGGRARPGRACATAAAGARRSARRSRERRHWRGRRAGVAAAARPGRRVRTNCFGGAADALVGWGLSLGEFERRLRRFLGVLGRFRRLGRLLALASAARPTASFALALLGLEPFRQGCSLGKFRLRSRAVARTFPLAAGSSLREGFALCPWPPLPPPADFACSCAITRSSQPTKTHERICAPCTRYPPAAARSVIADWP